MADLKMTQIQEPEVAIGMATMDDGGGTSKIETCSIDEALQTKKKKIRTCSSHGGTPNNSNEINGSPKRNSGEIDDESRSNCSGEIKPRRRKRSSSIDPQHTNGSIEPQQRSSGDVKLRGNIGGDGRPIVR